MKRSRHSRQFVLAITLGLLWAGNPLGSTSAAAEPPEPSEPSGAAKDEVKRLTDEAAKKVAEGDLKAAIAALEKATELSSREPRVLIQLAKVKALDKDLAGAFDLYRASVGPNADDETRAQARAALEELAPELHLGRVKLSVKPPSAAVFADGQSQVLDSDGVVFMKAGKYKLEARYQGCVTEHKQVRVAEGKTNEVAFALMLPKAKGTGASKDPCVEETKAAPEPAEGKKPDTAETTPEPKVNESGEASKTGVFALGLLLVKTTPDNAKLTIDGQSYPNDGKKGISLVEGDHQLEVTAAGFKPRRMTVKIPAGQPKLVNVTLQPESE